MIGHPPPSADDVWLTAPADVDVADRHVVTELRYDVALYHVDPATDETRRLVEVIRDCPDELVGFARAELRERAAARLGPDWPYPLRLVTTFRRAFTVRTDPITHHRGTR